MRQKNQEKSLNNPDSSRLCFHSHDDALRYVREFTESAKRWTALEYGNFAEGYRKNQLSIVVNCSFADRGGDYDFIFSAVPSRRNRQHVGRTNSVRVFKDNFFDENTWFNNASMLGGVTDFIQCPKGRSSSFVWLERGKKRLDFFRDMSTFAFEIASKISHRIPEGKVRGFLSTSGNNGTSSMIQRRAEAFDNLNGNAREGIGQWPSKLEFIDCVTSLRVFLVGSRVILRVKKFKRSIAQFNYLLLCPTDSLVGSMESFSRHICRIAQPTWLAKYIIALTKDRGEGWGGSC